MPLFFIYLATILYSAQPSIQICTITVNSVTQEIQYWENTVSSGIEDISLALYDSEGILIDNSTIYCTPSGITQSIKKVKDSTISAIIRCTQEPVYFGISNDIKNPQLDTFNLSMLSVNCDRTFSIRQFSEPDLNGWYYALSWDSAVESVNFTITCKSQGNFK